MFLKSKICTFVALISLLILCEVLIVLIILRVDQLWEGHMLIEGDNQPFFEDIIKIPGTNSSNTSKNRMSLKFHSNCIPSGEQINNTRRRRNVTDRLDWRDYNVIRPVMYQGLCSGCWAIGIIENMESIAAIRDIDTSLTALSVQQLIDCSKHNNGCHGGNIETALTFLCDTQLGITTAKEYPNIFRDEPCRKVEDGKRKISEFWLFDESNDEELLEMLQRGPLVAVVNAIPWMFYTGGVIQNSCPSEIQNHVVQIVGYDKISNPPFFIVRNSWGEDWGENGYVRLAIGKGICGINREIAYFNVI